MEEYNLIPTTLEDLGLDKEAVLRGMNLAVADLEMAYLDLMVVGVVETNLDLVRVALAGQHRTSGYAYHIGYEFSLQLLLEFQANGAVSEGDDAGL